MKNYTPEELQTILVNHRAWRLGEPKGIRANLSGADLSGADLSGANLSGADLSGANLRSANLRSADLRSADLSGADLRSADLRSADLSGADLSGANLRSADLRSATFARSQGIPYAQVAWSGHGECGRQLLAAVIDGATVYFCGCFKGSEEELRDYIANGAAEYRDSRTKALEFVKSCMP